MGGSLRISCAQCGFDRSVVTGVGMIGIEHVPAVCRRCVDIVSIERIWAPLLEDPEQVAVLRDEYGVEADADFVCPECSSTVEELETLEGDDGANITIQAACPACGHELMAEDGMMLWD